MFYGHVYSDDGSAMCGVRVSDGRSIAVTDCNGYYELEGWERAHVISVQQLTTRHSDWFAYIKEGEVCYDFTVAPYSFGEDSSFIHFSDTEIGIDGFDSECFIDFVKATIAEQKPNFLIHTGDICRKYGLEKHFKDMCSENMGLPVRYTLGNHDYVDDRYGEYTFESLYGPLWYSFDAGNIHYVCLPITKGEAKGLYLPEDRLLWLKSDLEYMKDGQRLVIFSHGCDEEYSSDGILYSGEMSLDLREHGMLAWAFGHLHVNFINEREGRFVICSGRPDSGGIDAGPASVRIVNISEGGELSSRVIYNRKNSQSKAECRRVVIEGESIFSSPIYSGEKIFVATMNDGYPRSCGIYAMDLAGEILWHYPTENSVKRDIAFAEGKIYAIDGEGYVYAINAENGAQVYKNKLPYDGNHSTSSGLAYSDGRLYVGSNTKAYVLSAESGEILLESEHSTAHHRTLPHPQPLGDKIIWPKHWDALYVIDAKSGRIISRNTQVKDAVANPLLLDGKIYAPTRYGIMKLSSEGNLLASLGGYGENEFNTPATPVEYDGILYVPSTTGGIRAIDCEGLSEVCRFECGESLLAACPYTPLGSHAAVATPLIDGEELIFGAADGYVYFYGMKTKRLNRRVSVGHAIISGVVKTDGGYAVFDFDGGVSFIK